MRFKAFGLFKKKKRGVFTYQHDGIATTHNADFIRDPRFVEAYGLGVQNGRPNLHVEWRVHVALWCATQALRLEGDFVECGVHTAIMASAILKWTNFGQTERKFFLFDTWAGIPAQQISQEEERLGISTQKRKYQNGDAIYEGVVSKVAPWRNCIVVRGRVPDSLSAMQDCKQVAFVSMDMNVAAAEMDAAAFLWPRMVPGGFLLLDDYGWTAHAVQKRAWDEFARAHKVMILSLPTGQGLILKP